MKATRRGNATEYSDYITCDPTDYEEYKDRIREALAGQVEIAKAELGLGDEAQGYYAKPYIRFDWSLVVPDEKQGD